MYWNGRKEKKKLRWYLINSNMRCIETKQLSKYRNIKFRLIVTWDVLKHTRSTGKRRIKKWLIVTWDVLKPWNILEVNRNDLINSNMRCIETYPCTVRLHLNTWLIVTWDVLKHFLQMIYEKGVARLIVTWDVLKQRWHHARIAAPKRLIVTWDVLKQSF